MLRVSGILLRLSGLLLPLALAGTIFAQAPSSLQIFMPGGALPRAEVRFRMVSEDGQIDSYFFTDSKGRFLIAKSQGLNPILGYTVIIEGDRSTFETTTIRFKEYNTYYIPIFLNPIPPKLKTRPATVDLSDYDIEAPKKAKKAFDLAQQALNEKKLDKAEAQLKRAIELYPKFLHALNDLGVIYMKRGRLAAASDVFEQAIAIAPKPRFPRLNLALVRTRQEKYQEAIEILKQLNKENPQQLDVRFPLADALIAAGRLDEAEPHLRAALADTRLNKRALADTHYKLGTLLRRRGKFEEAVDELTSAARTLPNTAQVHLQLGAALMQMDRVNGAETELLHAYRIGGAKMGAAQVLLGQLYLNANKYEAAIRAFEQYLTDVPQAPNATVVAGVIQQARSALKDK